MPLPILILARRAVLNFALVDLRFRHRHHSLRESAEVLKCRWLGLTHSDEWICSIDTSFRLMARIPTSSIFPFTLNRSVRSINGKRSLPFRGTSHITTLKLSRRNIRIFSSLVVADTKDSVQSTESPANARLTSSRNNALAASILSKICVGVRFVSDELGERKGVGLGETFSGVGRVTAGDGVTEGVARTIAGVTEGINRDSGGVDVDGDSENSWVNRTPTATEPIIRAAMKTQTAAILIL